MWLLVLHAGHVHCLGLLVGDREDVSDAALLETSVVAWTFSGCWPLWQCVVIFVEACSGCWGGPSLSSDLCLVCLD